MTTTTDIVALLDRIRAQPAKAAPAFADLIDIYEERRDRWIANVEGEEVASESLIGMLVEIELRSGKRPVVVHLV